MCPDSAKEYPLNAQKYPLLFFTDFFQIHLQKAEKLCWQLTHKFEFMINFFYNKEDVSKKNAPQKH